MLNPVAPNPMPAAHVSPLGELGVLAGIGVFGLAVAGVAGWLVSGEETAIAGAAGAGAAVVGGFAGWAGVTLLNRGHAQITAAPMLGMLIRLGVTAAVAGFCVLGLELERKPVLFGALFGYLLMMAAETYLLYRFASRQRNDLRSTADTASAGLRQETL